MTDQPHLDSEEFDEHDRDRADARARIAQLVADAERLLELARRQAEDIVHEAEAKARAASADILRESEQIREQARREADELFRSAEQDRDEARRILADAPDRAAAVAEGRTADEVIRVAQAEAEARARSLVEDAQRRVENAETEGRRRLEQMKNEYRSMQQRIRQEEFAAKARVVALRDEVEELENRRAELLGSAGPPPADEASAAPVDDPDPELPGEPFSQVAHHGISDEPAAQTLNRFTATVSDPDRALRGIRRRA